MTDVELKTRRDLIAMIPDFVAAAQAVPEKREALIQLRIDLGRRNWHFEKTEKGLSIGESGSSFSRQIHIVNPQDREFWKRHGEVKCKVLWFGAYGWTRLLVYTDSWEDAIKECAAWLAEHAPGHIMAHSSDEHIALIKEACEDAGTTYEQAMADDDLMMRICESAETDLTYTESGFLTSHEYGIALENPDTETLYQFIHGA